MACCRGVVMAAVAMALGAALACASTQQTPGVEPSGFLGDYSQLRPGKAGQALLVYIDAEADFSPYTRVWLEPVSVWHREEGSLTDVSDRDLKRLTHHLEQALRSQLAHDFELVEEARAGTLRIRTALTEAVGSQVALDIATTVLYPVSGAKKLATGTHAFVGRAAIEVEILDAESGRRLAAAVDERAGGKRLEGSTDTWTHVEAAFDYWAERLAARLAALRHLDTATEGAELEKPTSLATPDPGTPLEKPTSRIEP